MNYFHSKISTPATTPLHDIFLLMQYTLLFLLYSQILSGYFYTTYVVILFTNINSCLYYTLKFSLLILQIFMLQKELSIRTAPSICFYLYSNRFLFYLNYMKHIGNILLIYGAVCCRVTGS